LQWRWNPGLHTWLANALPLSSTPTRIFLMSMKFGMVGSVSLCDSMT
jgi:hypothetical protein